MQKVLLTSYFIVILLFVAGCSLPFLDEKKVSSEPVKTYKLQGTVLEKQEEEVSVATPVVAGKVKGTNEELSKLNIGDTVKVLATLDEIIMILPEEESTEDFQITTDGFNYQTLGYVGDKIANDDAYALQVAGELISGNINVSGEIFQQMEIGQQVKIFADLDGIKAVVAISEQEEPDDQLGAEDNTTK